MKSKHILVAAAAVAAVASAAAFVPARAEDASVGIQKMHIYPAIDAAEADIQAALAEARRTHKRVIVDFGGDWCPDCQVLNIYFHQSPNAGWWPSTSYA